LQAMLLYCQKWAHELCPLPFEVFIQQAEKLCGTNIVRVSLISPFLKMKEKLARLEEGESVESLNFDVTQESAQNVETTQLEEQNIPLNNSFDLVNEVES
jgi:hypothetical protein